MWQLQNSATLQAQVEGCRITNSGSMLQQQHALVCLKINMQAAHDQAKTPHEQTLPLLAAAAVKVLHSSQASSCQLPCHIQK
jgi:hypothetical protein